MEISNLYIPSRCLRLDPAQSVRRFSVHVFASELKFYVTKSRSCIKCIGALASRRAANRLEPMKIRMPHAPEISVALKIFGARTRPPCHLSKHFSNASTSRIREQHLYIRYRVLTEKSWARMNPRQVSMFFVFAFLCGMLRLCAYVRTHVIMRKRSRAIRLYKVPRYFLSVVYLYHCRAACTSVVNTAIGKSKTNARWKMKNVFLSFSNFIATF